MDRAVLHAAGDPPYANHVADRFDLRADIQFDTRVTSAVFDERRDRWVVAHRPRRHGLGAVRGDGRRLPVGGQAARGRRASTRSRGPTYHTGRWPHEGVDFTGQRVGVIGTGSSGIQSIPLIAEQAAHLTVFQRTPNFSMPAQERAARPERSCKP